MYDPTGKQELKLVSVLYHTEPRRGEVRNEVRKCYSHLYQKRNTKRQHKHKQPQQPKITMSSPVAPSSSMPPKRVGGRTSRSQRIRAQAQTEQQQEGPQPALRRSQQVDGNQPASLKMPALRRVRCSSNIEARPRPALQRSPLVVPERPLNDKAATPQHLVSVMASIGGVAGPRAA